MKASDGSGSRGSEAGDRLPGGDPATLEAWLTAHLTDARAPFEFKAIAGGHSNITYRMVDRTGTALVLRRPPFGIQPPGAHDMAREFRIQSALRDTPVPVPRVEVLCEDCRVIGAPFYVMQWVDGVVVDSPASAAAALPDETRRVAVAQEAINTLGAIHQLDIDQVGLGGLGWRDDFVARQIERMRRVWEKIRTRDIPLIDSLHARLVRHRPPQRYTGLVHNDFRLGNLLLSPAGRINAVLDWELAAVGDVLVDIGALVNNWDGPSDSGPDVWMQPAPTRAGGFPDRAALVAAYAASTGFDVSDLNFYRALSYWRIAIIGEGMKRRYESGEMGGSMSSIEAIARRVQERAELAHTFLSS